MAVIVNIVVFFALGLACVFIASWLFSRDMRERIEQPKFDFLDKVRGVEEALPGSRRVRDGANNEA
jgi:hypothetical protein